MDQEFAPLSWCVLGTIVLVTVAGSGGREGAAFALLALAVVVLQHVVGKSRERRLSQRPPELRPSFRPLPAAERGSRLK